jgi:enoyl-CoA hydratase
MKLIVNQTYESMGLHSTQTLGPILDGLMRNTPDAHGFIERATRDGVRAATNDRDALFGDYSMAGPDRRPDPSHVIDPS